MDFGGGEDIRFEKVGHVGQVRLCRPKALNALTHGMVKALWRALEAWEDDSEVAAVVVRGEGRAFCAGGDVRAVYDRRAEPFVDFFADEYRLNARIESYPKPYVALVDGIVMGGGVGISCHGSHRVFSENAVLAMPEVGIGFFPDVGGSHILPGLPSRFGFYLGLTGNRIRRGDALWCGVATHAVEAEKLDRLAARIAETGDVEGALAQVAAPVAREASEEDIAAIARHFSAGSVEEIMAGLHEAVPDSAFAAATHAAMLAKSPTSLLVTFRQLTLGKGLGMADCMRMEFRIVNRMLRGHDFYEGVRAALVDRSRPPAWQPATLAEVDPADIDAYFQPLGRGELGSGELSL